jgi:hypothetical protein
LDILRSLLSDTLMQNNRISVEQFETGQIWELNDSNLEIGLVGKTLVHYKLYKGKTKRAPTSLAPKNVLKKYLEKKKAVLTGPSR